MNLNMIQPEKKIEQFLLSITKNCETPVNIAYRTPEETLEFKLQNKKKHFIWNHQFQLEDLGC